MVWLIRFPRVILATADWDNVPVILPIMTLATLIFWTQYRKLNLMLLGDETAITLGTDLHKARIAYMLLSSFMVGFAVCAAGMIGFVGLIIPHAMRMLFGTDHKRLIPLSALTGSPVLWSKRNLKIGPNGSGKSTLSGGEQQRVILARALAQQTPCLILDEPTNHLDITHQLQLMRIVKNLSATVISAIHDLNIAAMFCDRIYALKEGRIIAQGTPREVLTEDFIRQVYQVDAEIAKDSSGQMHILFKG